MESCILFESARLKCKYMCITSIGKKQFYKVLVTQDL